MLSIFQHNVGLEQKPHVQLIVLDTRRVKLKWRPGMGGVQDAIPDETPKKTNQNKQKEKIVTSKSEFEKRKMKTDEKSKFIPENKTKMSRNSRSMADVDQQRDNSHSSSNVVCSSSAPSSPYSNPKLAKKSVPLVSKDSLSASLAGSKKRKLVDATAPLTAATSSTAATAATTSLQSSTSIRNSSENNAPQIKKSKQQPSPQQQQQPLSDNISESDKPAKRDLESNKTLKTDLKKVRSKAVVDGTGRVRDSLADTYSGAVEIKYITPTTAPTAVTTTATTTAIMMATAAINDELGMGMGGSSAW